MDKFSEIRVPISDDNPSIKRIEDLCVKCGMCKDVCARVMAVDAHYKKDCNEVVCINCGQCANVCPMRSIVEKDDSEKVETALNGDKKVVFVTSPAVRVALGEGFDLPVGEFVAGKMVTALKNLGADYVFDTTCGADVTVMEEASELLDRIKTNKPLPMFTSCCPAWVKFVETFYPEKIENLSTCKSPISMLSSLITSYFAGKIGCEPQDLFVVAVTPCVAKKFEISRSELVGTADAVISTRELINMLKKNNTDFVALRDSEFDTAFPTGSGAGVIFGASGGVMEAAVRTAYYLTTNKTPPEDLLKFEALRRDNNIKVATVELLGKVFTLCVVYGTANAKRVLDNPESYHFDYLEVMACPNGCVGGGGQPINPSKMALRKRAEALYDFDRKTDCRCSHENLIVKNIYDEFLIAPNSETSHKYLHTHYRKR